MSPETLSVVILGSLCLLLALGTEIAVAFGLIGSVGLLLLGQPQLQIAQSAWSALNVAEFVAVPLFIMMGAVLNNSGVIEYLFNGVNKWLASLPGSLACSVLGACAIFGAMSGSNVASAAVFGKAIYPEMEKQGYDPKLSLPCIAIGGTLAVLIPPSLIMIIFGGWQQLSIPRLFAAGIIPGIILFLMLLATVIIMVKLNPKLSPPVTVRYSWKDRIASIKGLFPWLMVILLVLGVIFGGIMTSTEAASLGAFLSVVLALLYRKMSYRILKDSFLEAVQVSAALFFIVAMAKVLVYVLQRMGVLEVVTSGIIGLELGSYGTLIMIYVLYLILGMFFDSISMMMLTLPFIMPVITHLGIDHTWFAVAYVVIAEIGMVTPPFGINLFVLNSVVPRHSILTVARGSVPFVVTCLVFIAILTAFPQLALWLPSVLF